MIWFDDQLGADSGGGPGGLGPPVIQPLLLRFVA